MRSPVIEKWSLVKGIDSLQAFLIAIFSELTKNDFYLTTAEYLLNLNGVELSTVAELSTSLENLFWKEGHVLYLWFFEQFDSKIGR